MIKITTYIPEYGEAIHVLEDGKHVIVDDGFVYASTSDQRQRLMVPSHHVLKVETSE